MLHNDASEAGFSHYGFFVLQNAGILLGFSIMLIIAMFEHKIQLNIEFWFHYPAALNYHLYNGSQWNLIH